jgi:hypothetical protein
VGVLLRNRPFIATLDAAFEVVHLVYGEIRIIVSGNSDELLTGQVSFCQHQRLAPFLSGLSRLIGRIAGIP